MTAKPNYIFSSIWNKIKNDSKIREYLGITIDTPLKEVREQILPSLPIDYIKLPKIAILGKVNARTCPSIPFLDEVTFQVHVVTYDSDYLLNIEILEYIRDLIDEQTLPVEPDYGLAYWSGFHWLNEGNLSTTTPDTYDYYHSYKTEILRQFSSKLGA